VRGIVQLYRVTGEHTYLEQAKQEWQGVIDSGNVLLQGAVPEMFAPAVKRDEGCSEADWLRLSLELWQLTRDSQCLRQAELTLFNEFAFNQFHSGDFGHHLLAADGIAPDFAHAWWCCTFHGLRAMAVLFDYAFHQSDGALEYDLPVDGRGGGAGLELRAESSLERNGTVLLTVLKSDGAPHVLQVRVPLWASEVKGALASARVWKTGETVTLTYVMRTREVRQAGRTAIFCGPWLLAVDETRSPNFFDEPYTENKVQWPAEPAPAAISAAAFSVPAAHMQIRYLPGGYPVQPGTALLRPMAEYTGGPDSNRLVFWLR
jgi:DUF1680 family protein